MQTFHKTENHGLSLLVRNRPSQPYTKPRPMCVGTFYKWASILSPADKRTQCKLKNEKTLDHTMLKFLGLWRL